MKPPATALSEVNVITAGPLFSTTLTSAIVTVVPSSSLIVSVPVSLIVTDKPVEARLLIPKVSASSPSAIASLFSVTVTVSVSPAVPAKLIVCPLMAV